MREVKYADIGELSAEGYLAEANRRFFHPLGLALERSTGWERHDVDQVLEELGATTQDEADVVWEFVQHLGLDRQHLTGVWDDRDDPEGIIYGDDLLPAVTEHARRIARIWAEREADRDRLLGYMVQPVDP